MTAATDGRTPDDRLDRFLDRLTGGDGVAPNGPAPDPALAETARRFHALDDDSAPLPAELVRIWEDLMDGTAAYPTPSRPFASPLGRATVPNGRHAPPRRVPVPTPTVRGRRGWPMTEAAVAAAVLLAAATGYLGYRDTPAPPGGGETAFGAVVQDGTPVVTVPENGLEDCRVAPRPVGTAAVLAGEPPTIPALLPRVNRPSTDRLGAAYEVVAPEEVIADAPAADAETVAAIDDALREINACRFYRELGEDDPPGYASVDDDGRSLARYSDDFFRRELAGFREEGEEPGLRKLIVPWAPEPPTVDGAWRLPDGRVAATLLTSTHFEWTPADVRDLFVFVEVDGRWLVDETGALGSVESAGDAVAAGTPGSIGPHPVSKDEDPTFVEVVLREPVGPSAIPFYPDVFRAETDVTIVLANVGSAPHRFEIDPLGVAVEVPPGESRKVVLNGPAGEYLVESYVPDARDASRDVQVMSDQLTLVPAGEEIGKG